MWMEREASDLWGRPGDSAPETALLLCPRRASWLWETGCHRLAVTTSLSRTRGLEWLQNSLQCLGVKLEQTTQRTGISKLPRGGPQFTPTACPYGGSDSVPEVKMCLRTVIWLHLLNQSKKVTEAPILDVQPRESLQMHLASTRRPSQQRARLARDCHAA